MEKHFLLLLVILVTFCNCNNPSKNFEEYTWDFSKDKTYNYLFEFNNYVVILDSNGVDTSSFVAKMTKGLIVFESNNDNTADFITKDIQITNIIENIDYCDTITFTSPDIKVKNIDIYCHSDDKSVNNSFKIMFPLPHSDIVKGETIDIEIEQSFQDVNTGEILTVKGINELTLEGYEEYSGHNCAVLKSEFDICDLVSSEYALKVELIGTGLHYFDIDNNNYVASNVTLYTDIEYFSYIEYGNTKIKTFYGIEYDK